MVISRVVMSRVAMEYQKKIASEVEDLDREIDVYAKDIKYATENMHDAMKRRDVLVRLGAVLSRSVSYSTWGTVKFLKLNDKLRRKPNKKQRQKPSEKTMRRQKPSESRACENVDAKSTCDPQ